MSATVKVECDNAPDDPPAASGETPPVGASDPEGQSITCAVAEDPGSTTKCSGCPATYNGLPCASTTHYSDGQMGACEMGQPPDYANSPPDGWWNFTSFTAAINSQSFNYGTAATVAYGDLGNCGCASG